MKKLALSLILLILAGSVVAQDTTATKKTSDNAEMKTLFGKSHPKIPIGYFLELNAGYTRFGGNDVFLPGLSTGIILNHHWTIGASGSFIGNWNGLYYKDIYLDSSTLTMRGAYLHGGYGGLLLEYTLMPNSIVHISFPLMIGGGYMYYNSSYHDSTFYDNNHHHMHYHAISDDAFFVIEPGVRVEFNIIKLLRLGLGVSYRYVPDLDLQNTSTSLLNQFTGRITLRIGKF
jgi:hypothetical protein